MKSDESLMRAYRDGDQAALRELYSRYSPLLMRILGRDLDRSDEARDLLQQTFLQLHRARADFRDDSRVRPWIITIALNLKRDYFRRRRRRPLMHGDALDDTELVATYGSPDKAAEATRVRAALEKLPQGQRDAIILHWFEGFSFPEVAEIVGGSPSAVKVRAHRGYERLRTVLSDLDVTEPAGGHTHSGRG